MKDFFSKQELEDQLKDTDRADDKIVLVTGANSGLGFGIAVDMAKRGAHVLMACRRQIPEAGEKVEMIHIKVPATLTLIFLENMRIMGYPKVYLLTEGEKLWSYSTSLWQAIDEKAIK